MRAAKYTVNPEIPKKKSIGIATIESKAAPKTESAPTTPRRQGSSSDWVKCQPDDTAATTPNRSAMEIR